MGIDRQFVHISIVSRSQMDESHTFIQFYDLTIFWIVATGIDIYLMSSATQFPSKLSDIDVHTPSVFSPQLTYRTGMDA